MIHPVSLHPEVKHFADNPLNTMPKITISTQDGHHIAVELPHALHFGAASDAQILEAAKAIAVGFNEANRTFPPAAEV